MTVANCVDGVERRGSVYYLRWRVPAEFKAVEPRTEINQSLRTRDEAEARGVALLKKKALQKVWKARLLQEDQGPSLEAFEAAVALLDDLELPYVPVDGLLAGKIEKLVSRIEKLAGIPADLPMIPAALGVLDVPHVKILEMPAVIEDRCKHKLKGMHADQKRQWRNRYKHAARIFADVVSNKYVHEITEDDAQRYCNHWQARVNSGSISDDQAIKRLRYLRQMVAEFHSLAGTLPSQLVNPVVGFKIEPRPKKDRSSNQGGKASLPVAWVRDLVSGTLTEGIEVDERVDIAIVLAETGGRQTEIVHAPPEDIILDHEIPHMLIRYVEDGEFCRHIKNVSSIRAIPLLGRALEIMRRYPDGFSRYRAKGTFSGEINKFMRDNNLFPAPPEGLNGYTFGGTRHTWEERGRAAGMDNEERAFMLGHSVGKVRGRPVYGDGPKLKLRALLAELVAFPTESWRPRPQKEIWRVIKAVLDAEGFRVE
ncbi:hypothetical protein LR948_12190 [Roseivivax sp. GX 12232]|uniref:DUF6538 domain-containing protein n=1 Tax=Roseivivax sp. GX 12232 TaxID=2900547 RepID=UPI001E36DDA7|nr:DUF6538 domain-containing protein [Roseivivax sp. GX 12232]MCE0506121.1 hypothetical protein [Roseivivax sp. GX 12232]